MCIRDRFTFVFATIVGAWFFFMVVLGSLNHDNIVVPFIVFPPCLGYAYGLRLLIAGLETFNEDALNKSIWVLLISYLGNVIPFGNMIYESWNQRTGTFILKEVPWTVVIISTFNSLIFIFSAWMYRQRAHIEYLKRLSIFFRVQINAHIL
eukprot:TRINITY_DN11634_c0_g1_i1.p1 TRINITY_DN11634_c0_g1~~TRINITY_DN11634_c0_g1_i1.p1  ORF type:complete len:171 (+),score=38.65 TRINITY_DN11634_c0_g1_i1:62-514(+)